MASVHGHLHGFTWGQSTGQLMPVRCNLHQRGVRVGGSTPQPPNPTQFPRGSLEGGSPVAHGGNPLINTLLLTFLHSWSHFPTPLQCFLRSSPKEPLVAKSLSSVSFWGNPKQQSGLVKHGYESSVTVRPLRTYRAEPAFPKGLQ